MGFAAHPDEPGRLYSSGHPAPGTRLRNPVGFTVSTDAGATWEVRSLHGEVDFHSMEVSPADGDIVYGWYGEQLYVSRDAGSSWDTTGDALAGAGGASSLAGHPDDSDEVWAAAPAGLLRSRDGGQSWELVRSGQSTAVAFDPGDGDRVLAYVAAEGLLESHDGGQSWTPLGLELEEDAAGYIAVHPDDPETVYVGTYGQGVLRSADGGTRWTSLAVNGVPQR